MQSYAGQTDQTEFRIGADISGVNTLVYSTDPNIEMSFNDARGFAPALTYSVGAGAVGSTIFVKLSAPLDPTEGDRTSQIIAGNEVLSVAYFLASTNQGDTERSPADRFLGTETINILEQFQIEGESVIVYRHDPIPKPTEVPTTAVSIDRFASLNDPAEWCNPNNPISGYILQDVYPTKVFIGDQDLTVDTLHDYLAGTLTFSDVSRILLPPDFSGFNPSAVRKQVAFGSGITTQTPAFQRTQWTIKRNNAEYALLNIRKQSYFRGQFLYFIADLARVNYPGADSTDGFLPWNQLYDVDGKIIQYVKPWSRVERCDPYNPYCDVGGSV